MGRWYLDGVLISSDSLLAPADAPTATHGRYPGHRDAVERSHRDGAGPERRPGSAADAAGTRAPDIATRATAQDRAQDRAATHTSAAGQALAGAPAHAVDDAMRMEGLHERRDRDAVRQYLRTGGAGMDPATTAWCAAFVNASLQREGVRGSGSAVATSFMAWGQPATGEIQRGDVLVRNRGRRAGQTGGHVGMATGATRQGPHGTEYEMISGNSADQVRRTWEPAHSVIARRAATAGAMAPTPAAGGAERAPASIRYNNPGAQYPSARARDFGQEGYGVIGGGHQIARFPTPEQGAAANMDLFSRSYTGMPLGAAGQRWTGSYGFGVPGYDSRAVITKEMMRDPEVAIPLMKSIAHREAGRPSPLTDAQWKAAHDMFLAGGSTARQAATEE